MQAVEDEQHFLFDCPFYSIIRGQHFSLFGPNYQHRDIRPFFKQNSHQLGFVAHHIHLCVQARMSDESLLSTPQTVSYKMKLKGMSRHQFEKCMDIRYIAGTTMPLVQFDTILMLHRSLNSMQTCTLICQSDATRTAVFTSAAPN